MPSLYELTTELQTIAAQLEAITDADEITPELGDRLAALLCDASDTHQEWIEKIDNTAALIRNRSAWLDGIDREIARLQELRRVESNRVAWLKQNLMLAMSVRGTDKLVTPRGKLSICRNGGKQPIALNPAIEPDQLPEKFQRVSISPDLDAIRTAIEAGDPEAESIAQFRERGHHLRIR